MDPQITLGEIMRRLTDHGEILAEIRADVKATNGAIASAQREIAVHDARLDAHDRELRDVKRGGIDGKVVAVLLAALAALTAVVTALAKGLL